MIFSYSGGLDESRILQKEFLVFLIEKVRIKFYNSLLKWIFRNWFCFSWSHMIVKPPRFLYYTTQVESYLSMVLFSPYTIRWTKSLCQQLHYALLASFCRYDISWRWIGEHIEFKCFLIEHLIEQFDEAAWNHKSGPLPCLPARPPYHNVAIQHSILWNPGKTAALRLLPMTHPYLDDLFTRKWWPKR